MTAGVKCQECSKPITVRRRRVCCSDRCLAIRTARLVRQYNSQRVGKLPDARYCVVCGVEYVPVSSNQRYCPEPDCKATGLRRAIERQQQKRSEARSDRDLQRLGATE